MFKEYIVTLLFTFRNPHLPKSMVHNGTDILRQRGVLVIFEGLDRSGKSTQAKLLEKYFKQMTMKAKIQRFPDREEPITGPIIDKYLRNELTLGGEAIHLYFTTNRWLLKPTMVEELTTGHHLIVDRYSHSGIAYSLAKGLDRRWVCMPEVGLLKPDLVIFLDANSEKVSQREGFGNELMERSEFQQLVYSNMNHLFDNAYWRRIDANNPVNDVHKAVVEEVCSLLESMSKANGIKPLVEFSPNDFGI